MKFEDRVFMDVRCSVPYVNGRKMKQSGIVTRLSLGQVFDLGAKIEGCADIATDSCLRSGLLLNTDFTVCVCNCRENNFVIGRAEILGIGGLEKCKCDKGYDVMSDSVKGRSRFCFNQLASGKCQDQFVRDTVGVALFPQYYAMQKTK